VNGWWCRPDIRPEEERGVDVEHGVKGERFEDVRVDLRGATQEEIIPERSTMKMLSGLVDSGRANFGTRVNTRAREWGFKEGSQGGEGEAFEEGEIVIERGSGLEISQVWRGRCAR
jgi:hypothetical protein